MLFKNMQLLRLEPTTFDIRMTKHAEYSMHISIPYHSHGNDLKFNCFNRLADS